MSDLDLHAIQDRANAARGAYGGGDLRASADDVPDLLARIRELEAQVAATPLITGHVVLDVNHPPHVNLTLSNGTRVTGFVDDGLGKHMGWSNPALTETNPQENE